MSNEARDLRNAIEASRIATLNYGGCFCVGECDHEQKANSARAELDRILASVEARLGAATPEGLDAIPDPGGFTDYVVCAAGLHNVEVDAADLTRCIPCPHCGGEPDCGTCPGNTDT